MSQFKDALSEYTSDANATKLEKELLTILRKVKKDIDIDKLSLKVNDDYKNGCISISDTGGWGYLAHMYFHGVDSCCGVVVANNLEVTDEYRRKGLAKFMLKLAKLWAKQNEYGQIIAITASDPYERGLNRAQHKMLAAAKFNKTSQFKNPKTNNTLCTYTFNIGK